MGGSVSVWMWRLAALDTWVYVVVPRGSFEGLL